MSAAPKYVVRGNPVQAEDDPADVARAAETLLFLGDRYFRSEMHIHDLQLANGKSSKPVLFASNHSGMSFPWDGIVLTASLYRRFGSHLPFKTLVAYPMLRFRIMRLFGFKGTWSKFCVEANMDNFDMLLASGKSALIYPEGIAGIGKGFNRKYQLQKFSTSSVRMCLKHGYDLVPIYTVNGEYINPFAYRFAFLDRIVQTVGIPFLPIGFSLLLVAFFPFVFYMAWPANLKFVIGPRINIRNFFDKPYDQLSVHEAAEITRQVQALMQAGLSEAVLRYEGRRWDLPGFFQQMRKLGPKALLMTPLTWAYLFHRGFAKKPTSSLGKIKAALICVSMVLPVVGWPLFLALICFDKPEFEKTKKAS